MCVRKKKEKKRKTQGERELERATEKEGREKEERERESNIKLAAIEGAIQFSREKAPEISKTQKANAVKQRIEAL